MLHRQRAIGLPVLICCALLVAGCIAVTLSGCGGGSSSGPGTLAFTIAWPELPAAGVVPAEIPAATQCIAVKLSNASDWHAEAVALRPASANTSTLTLTDVPPGPVHFYCGAYDSYTDNSGNILVPGLQPTAFIPAGNLLAWAAADVDVAVGAISTVKMSLSTQPVRVAVTSVKSTSLLAGQTLDLTATAYDGPGNVLFVSNVAWSSADTTVATVDVQGTVKAVSTGATTITASVGNVFGQIAISVAGGSITRDLTSVLLPGYGQSYTSPSIGLSSLLRGYVAQVVPTSGSSPNAFVQDVHFQSDSDGTVWQDQLHVKSGPVTSNVNADIRIFDISALPRAADFTPEVSAGEHAGWSLPLSSTKRGYVAMATPLDQLPSGEKAFCTVHCEYAYGNWTNVVRVDPPDTLTSRVGATGNRINIRVYDVSQLPTVMDQDVTLAAGVEQSWIIANSTISTGYVPAISPLSNWTANITFSLRPEYNGTRWQDVLRISSDQAITLNARVFRVDPAGIQGAAAAQALGTRQLVTPRRVP